MRKLLNTLYITNEKAVLRLEGETIYIEVDNAKLGQFPLHTFENIVCFSYIGATPALMGECAKRGIGLNFFSPYGKFLCRTVGASRGNVLLRKAQYRISDSEEASCQIARNFIIGKVYNSRWTLDRTLRDHELRVNDEKIRKAIQFLDEGIANVRASVAIDSLRGVEGECASIYFSAFDEMILNQKEDFYLRSRNRRPPLDNVNSMLSYGYTLLSNDCANALEGVGLDSYVGFLHQDRPGRQSMALDLMEELRPIIVDRFVISMINNRQIQSRHFEYQESGAVRFTAEGKKKFLTAWQEHKRETIRHPFLKEKIPWGLVPHVQALLLARHIRGDLEGYPPFLWK